MHQHNIQTKKGQQSIQSGRKEELGVQLIEESDRGEKKAEEESDRRVKREN
jgi:hypothetical protein